MLASNSAVTPFVSGLACSSVKPILLRSSATDCPIPDGVSSAPIGSYALARGVPAVGLDRPRLPRCAPRCDAPFGQVREVGNRGVVLDHMPYVRRGRGSGLVGIVYPVSDQPTSVGSVYHLSCGFRSVEHRPLNHRTKLPRKDAAFEWERQEPERFLTVAHSPRLPAADGRRKQVTLYTDSAERQFGTQSTVGIDSDALSLNR